MLMRLRVKPPSATTTTTQSSLVLCYSGAVSIGSRVFARDKKNKWYHGTIDDVSVHDDVHVTFDDWEHKWDEWYFDNQVGQDVLLSSPEGPFLVDCEESAAGTLCRTMTYTVLNKRTIRLRSYWFLRDDVVDAVRTGMETTQGEITTLTSKWQKLSHQQHRVDSTELLQLYDRLFTLNNDDLPIAVDTVEVSDIDLKQGRRVVVHGMAIGVLKKATDRVHVSEEAIRWLWTSLDLSQGIPLANGWSLRGLLDIHPSTKILLVPSSVIDKVTLDRRCTVHLFFERAGSHVQYDVDEGTYIVPIEHRGVLTVTVTHSEKWFFDVQFLRGDFETRATLAVAQHQKLLEELTVAHASACELEKHEYEQSLLSSDPLDPDTVYASYIQRHTIARRLLTERNRKEFAVEAPVTVVSMPHRSKVGTLIQLGEDPSFSCSVTRKDDLGRILTRRSEKVELWFKRNK